MPKVDILVNNLGIYEMKDFAAITDAEWRRYFEVNVLSGARLARAYFPGMLERNWGRVIFISSESGLVTPAEMTRPAAGDRPVPLTDGLAAAMMSTLKNGSRIFALALLDRFGSLFGRQPIYIPGHGMPGDLSIGATPDGPFGEKLMAPKDGTIWHDRVAARSLLSFSWRRPVRRAASVRIPSARCPRGRRYCARYCRPRGRPQGTGGRIVPQRRWSLRCLRRRSKLRRRAANGGRLPPSPREDRSPKGVLMTFRTSGAFSTRTRDGDVRPASGSVGVVRAHPVATSAVTLNADILLAAAASDGNEPILLKNSLVEMVKAH